jgi:DNA-binding transcriptional LysR family regulator
MAFDTRLLTGLNVLVAVLDAGNFVRAGQALGLTQSGVSRSIQRLEERLGIRLFERTSKSMRLTDEGNRFSQEVLPLLSRLEEAAEETVRSAGAVRGRLRVNIDATFARLVFAPRIGPFLKKYPDLHLDLVVRDQLGDLVAEGFDVAVRFGEPQPSALIARCLVRVRILTCASPTYLANRARPKTPHDLARQTHECLLFRDPATGQPFAWEFHQGKRHITVSVRGRVIVNDALTQIEACLSGCGVAQVMDLSVATHLKSGRLVNLFPQWSDELFPLYAYYPSPHFVPAKVRAFLDFLTRLRPQLLPGGLTQQSVGRAKAGRASAGETTFSRRAPKRCMCHDECK